MEKSLNLKAFNLICKSFCSSLQQRYVIICKVEKMSIYIQAYTHDITDGLRIKLYKSW